MSRSRAFSALALLIGLVAPTAYGQHTPGFDDVPTSDDPSGADGTAPTQRQTGSQSGQGTRQKKGSPRSRVTRASTAASTPAPTTNTDVPSGEDEGSIVEQPVTPATDVNPKNPPGAKASGATGVAAQTPIDLKKSDIFKTPTELVPGQESFSVRGVVGTKTIRLHRDVTSIPQPYLDVKKEDVNGPMGFKPLDKRVAEAAKVGAEKAKAYNDSTDAQKSGLKAVYEPLSAAELAKGGKRPDLYGHVVLRKNINTDTKVVPDTGFFRVVKADGTTSAVAYNSAAAGNSENSSLQLFDPTTGKLITDPSDFRVHSTKNDNPLKVQPMSLFEVLNAKEDVKKALLSNYTEMLKADGIQFPASKGALPPKLAPIGKEDEFWKKPNPAKACKTLVDEESKGMIKNPPTTLKLLHDSKAKSGDDQWSAFSNTGDTGVKGKIWIRRMDMLETTAKLDLGKKKPKNYMPDDGPHYRSPSDDPEHVYTVGNDLVLLSIPVTDATLRAKYFDADTFELKPAFEVGDGKETRFYPDSKREFCQLSDNGTNVPTPGPAPKPEPKPLPDPNLVICSFAPNKADCNGFDNKLRCNEQLKGVEELKPIVDHYREILANGSFTKLLETCKKKPKEKVALSSATLWNSAKKADLINRMGGEGPACRVKDPDQSCRMKAVRGIRQTFAAMEGQIDENSDAFTFLKSDPATCGMVQNMAWEFSQLSVTDYLKDSPYLKRSVEAMDDPKLKAAYQNALDECHAAEVPKAAVSASQEKADVGRTDPVTIKPSKGESGTSALKGPNDD